VPNVVLASLIAGFSYLSFFHLHFTCLFHSQSFQQVECNLAASVATSGVTDEGRVCTPLAGKMHKMGPLLACISAISILLIYRILLLAFSKISWNIFK